LGKIILEIIFRGTVGEVTYKQPCCHIVVGCVVWVRTALSGDERSCGRSQLSLLMASTA
jgi:hypothetical protein